jgi:hypothetical protein
VKTAAFPIERLAAGLALGRSGRVARTVPMHATGGAVGRQAVMTGLCATLLRLVFVGAFYASATSENLWVIAPASCLVVAGSAATLLIEISEGTAPTYLWLRFYGLCTVVVLWRLWIKVVGD